MNLSKIQRLFLYNQYLILKKLYPDEAEIFSKFCKILSEGYTREYSNMLEIFDEEMSEEKCKEVYDILDMYNSLNISYDGLSDKSGIVKERIQFPGFDGNFEGDQYKYALYLIDYLGRYENLRESKDKFDFLNSHSRYMDKYRAMLKVWKSFPVEKRYELNAQQIQEILEAHLW